MTAKKRPEEIRKNKELANKKRKLRHLWRGELELDEIAEELGMTLCDLKAFAEDLGLGPRPEIEVYLPTLEEIRLACAEFRAGWTAAELEARRTAWFGRLN